MRFKETLRQILRKSGFDIIRYHYNVHPLARRLHLLATHEINLVFDIGANTGQFAQQLRTAGFHGRIVSFEPQHAAHTQLQDHARNDPLWEVVNIALGEIDGQAELYIAGNTLSSSLLDMLPSHVRSAPHSAYVGTEHITVRKLDSIFNAYYRSGEKLYVKIDTQGFEKQVLNGAQKSFDKIVGIQMEMSLVPLYRGETLFTEMIGMLNQVGFTLMAVEPVFSDPTTGQLLQLDGVFFRTSQSP